MKMSLYDSAYRYTDDARDLDRRTDRAVRELFLEFVSRGYSPREIASIMRDMVRQIEAETVL